MARDCLERLQRRKTRRSRLRGRIASTYSARRLRPIRHRFFKLGCSWPPTSTHALTVRFLYRLEWEVNMPEKETIERAREDKREGKAPSTQAGEFVREEIHHIREGKHGARSTKQAIAIGLSKARRAGVDLKPPKKGKTSERTRKSAARAY